MAITFEELKSRCRNVHEKGTDAFDASCPCGNNHSHNDKTRSFSARLDSSSGKILVYCHKGCSFDSICSALGCGPHDLMPDKSEQEKQRQFLEWYAKENNLRFVSVYSYCYDGFADGLAKARFISAEGHKTFRWIKADASTKSGFKMTHSGCPNRLYVRGDLGRNEVFIAEGEKDADTLHMLTGYAAACTENGATEASDSRKWFEEYTQQLAGKTVYLLWDNDTTGKAFAEIEAAHILKSAAHLFMLDITTAWAECPDKGDITDMVEALGAEETKARLRRLVANAKERTQQAQDGPQDAEQKQGEQKEGPAQEAAQKPQNRDSVALFDDFMGKVQTKAYEPLQTGMQAFDRLLGGGIQRQALVILSAAPGTGKTTLVQQIFETMAAHGTDVIFLNLEMSREQLLARSLSRMIHRDGGSITASGILKGYAWTDEMRRYIEPAAARYRAQIAPCMHYNPEGCGTMLSSIIATLNNAAAAAKAAGKPAPVCVLDYLHLVTMEQREDQQEIIKKTVAALKQYAIENDTFVLAISANNRTSNSSGTVTLESGRDSSALEYTADIQLSLNYRALHEKSEITYTTADGRTVTEKASAGNPDHMEALQKEKPRKMLVQVLKNRMTEPGGKLYLNFDAANSEFIAVDTYIQAPAGLEGWKVITNDPYNPF